MNNPLRTIGIILATLLLLTAVSSCMLMEEVGTTPISKPSPVVQPVPEPAPVVPPPAPQVEPIPAPQVSTNAWSVSPRTLGADVGDSLTLKFAPGGTASSIWGTDIYTDDSAIGTAAVHMGIITFAQGGEVTIEIRKGLDSYRGSSRNTVTSGSYGPWDNSFVFLDRAGNPLVEAVEPEVQDLPTVTIPWDRTAIEWNGQIGKKVSLTLPPGGNPGPIWGTGIYTDDSLIGTAAVHMGLITFAQGGTVTIEILDGMESYDGSTRNGVTSESYDAWGGSYRFMDKGGTSIATNAPKVAANMVPDANWSTSASQWRDMVGSRYTIDLPPGGSPSSVWGTGIYTDDSSIGTAAVHAGLIEFATGGKVTIEITEGESSYEGSQRNGVNSSSYGAWHGSFVFID